MLIVREVKPEYNVPVGVWEVRETTKGAFDLPAPRSLKPKKKRSRQYRNMR